MAKHKKSKLKHKSKKDKKKHRKRERSDSSSSSSSSGDEWVEKTSKSPPPQAAKEEREDWLSFGGNLFTNSNQDRRKERELEKRMEKERDKYNPGTNSRELNPFWKDGGDGMPSTAMFKKPSLDDDEDYKGKSSNNKSQKSSGWRKKSKPYEEAATSSSNWRNKSNNEAQPSSSKNNSTITSATASTSKNISSSDDSDSNETPKLLSDKELNALGAKLVKAEIMGNTKLIADLKQKLESARKAKENATDEDNMILLTATDSKGYSKPITMQSQYGESSGSKKRKKQKVETHTQGERTRYFADDDNYSLKEMFEHEKFGNSAAQDAEFVRLAGKLRKNDDMDEIFTDDIRNKESSSKTDSRNKDKAINEHQKATKTLESCNKCIQSDNNLKHLIVSMGETTYLSIPPHEPLTDGHCLIVPIRHVVCATQLDENEWEEIINFRKCLTRMYQSKDEDVVFFETANYLNQYRHMVIECIPLPRETGDMAPIYFKKAIDESETEWATNKKLISLSGKNVRKAVPKGLPYFSVSFGMDEGFAHVIEDKALFPNNFAQEIIGGMLDLHYSKWRKPKMENFEQQSERVLEFSKYWIQYDCTS